MNPEQQKRQRREAVRAIRTAWAHRHTHPRRARIIIEANVQFLRALRREER